MDLEEEIIIENETKIYVMFGMFVTGAVLIVTLILYFFNQWANDQSEKIFKQAQVESESKPPESKEKVIKTKGKTPKGKKPSFMSRKKGKKHEPQEEDHEDYVMPSQQQRNLMKATFIENAPTNTKVMMTCPNCTQKIDSHLINDHLDVCLEKQPETKTEIEEKKEEELSSKNEPSNLYPKDDLIEPIASPSSEDMGESSDPKFEFEMIDNNSIEFRMPTQEEKIDEIPSLEDKNIPLPQKEQIDKIVLVEKEQIDEIPLSEEGQNSTPILNEETSTKDGQDKLSAQESSINESQKTQEHPDDVTAALEKKQPDNATPDHNTPPQKSDEKTKPKSTPEKKKDTTKAPKSKWVAKPKKPPTSPEPAPIIQEKQTIVKEPQSTEPEITYEVKDEVQTDHQTPTVSPEKDNSPPFNISESEDDTAPVFDPSTHNAMVHRIKHEQGDIPLQSNQEMAPNAWVPVPNLPMAAISNPEVLMREWQNLISALQEARGDHMKILTKFHHSERALKQAHSHLQIADKQIALLRDNSPQEEKDGTELRDARLRIAELESQIQQKDIFLQQQVQDLELRAAMDTQASTKHLQNAMNENSRLQTQASQFEKQQSAMNNRIQELHMLHRLSEQSKQSLEEETRRLTRQLGNKEEALKRETKSASHLRQQTDELKESCGKEQQKTLQLESELKVLREELSRKTTKLEDANQQNANLTTKAAFAQAEVKALRQEFKNATDRRRKTELDKLLNVRNRLKASLGESSNASPPKDTKQ